MKVERVFPLISTSLWGVSIVGAKVLGNNGVSPLEIVYFRFLLATVIFTPVLIVLARSGEKVLPSNDSWPPMIGLAITGVALNNYIFYKGLARTDASVASLLVSFNPLATMLFASMLLGEGMTRRRWGSAVIGILGVSLIVGSNPLEGRLVGNLLVLLGVCIWGLSFSFSKKLSNSGLHSIAVSGISEIVGVLMLVPFLATSTSKLVELSVESWVWLVMLGVFSSVIAYIIHYRAIEVLGAGTVAPSTNIIPLSGSITAFLVLGEPLSLLAVIGAIFVIIAVLIVQLEHSD